MKVLVVEDEHRIAQSIKKGFEQERYVVDVSFNGAEGFDMALSEEYDLLVLDRMLPEKDGIEICQDLRKQNVHTPILILTAKGQMKDKVEGLDAGADDYLTKPFSFEELLARARALIRRPKKMHENELRVDALSLNLTTYEVFRRDEKITLSGKEFSLLEFLMRHAGKTVTKEQIMTQVWDYDADILPNTIEVYIRNLRKKIDLPFADLPPLIHTVRGFGYRLGK